VLVCNEEYLLQAKTSIKKDATGGCPTTHDLLFSFSREVASGKRCNFGYHGHFENLTNIAMKADNSTLYLQDPTQENVRLHFNDINLL